MDPGLSGSSEGSSEGQERQGYGFEILSAEHKPLREAFRCGEPELEEYLKRRATQDMKRGLAVAHVMHDRQKERITAYYTLSSAVIERGKLPTELERSLGKNRAFPAILLGRLAVDLEYQGEGLGGETLLDALYRALELSRTSVGAVAVVVDALHEEAERFYAHYGFERLGVRYEVDEGAEAPQDAEPSGSNPRPRLYVPMKSIERL